MNRSTRRFRTCRANGSSRSRLKVGKVAGAALTLAICAFAPPSATCIAQSGVAGQGASVSGDEPTEAQILRWIEQLDDKSYGKREWASDQLHRHADAAFPILEKSMESAEGEAFTRMLQVVCDLIRSPNSPRKTKLLH